MPLYSYEAVSRDGKKSSDVTEADSEVALKEKLFAEGLTPLTIAPVERRESFTLTRVNNKDLLTFTDELANLLESGLPLDRALYVLSVHSEKPAMRELLGQVYVDIQRGQSLSQALARHKPFPRLYINMIRAGEVGGDLEVSAKRLSQFLATSVAFQEEVTSALIYPLLLTSVGGMAVMVLLLFVVPRLALIFKDMGQALPASTLLLLNVSSFLQHYWWALILAVAFSVVALRAYIATAEGQALADQLKIKIPLLRTLQIKIIIARFARTLGTLLQSGVPILEAIQVSRAVVGNSVVSRSLEALEDGVRSGRGISGPLKECGVFPPIVAQMIAVGEEAGRVEQTFLSVAERFEGESKGLITRAIRLFEPALILVMGLIVGFIVISLLMAVFSINDIAF